MMESREFTSDGNMCFAALHSQLAGCQGDRKHVVGFNDNSTHAQVLALFDSAIGAQP